MVAYFKYQITEGRSTSVGVPELDPFFEQADSEIPAGQKGDQHSNPKIIFKEAEQEVGGLETFKDLAQVLPAGFGRCLFKLFAGGIAQFF